MPRCTPFFIRLLPSLRQLISVRFFFLVTCISFTISVFWIQFVDKEYLLEVDESLIEEALENIARDYRYVNVYRKPDKLPAGIKYILLWTPSDYAPFYFFGSGQKGFLEKNCSIINCYVTDNRHFFGYGNLTQFDAVAFNGRNIYNMKSSLPQIRHPHQKYIFINMESADNYPVCNELYDDFFNWTATYRLDSDIPFPYILIRDIDGEVVGPKRDMVWAKDLYDTIDEDFLYKQQNKSKAAAWFVSHCSSRSGRNEFVNELQKSLARYGLSVDIYGSCGTLTCPRHDKANCDTILERDYYFYLSFENSFAEDYVTEKLLTALERNIVPIVFGGANYTRFLPPSSYLDAKKYTPDNLAAIMVALMKSPKDYRQFFKWKNYYTYHDPSAIENVCALCEALNDEEMMERQKRYKQFRKWWLPNFKERCNT